MLVGYARVSIQDQNLDLQLDALNDAGCKKVFQEKVSGKKADRVELKKAITYMRKGDVLCVWQLSRLGRSLKDLITIISDLNDNGIGFRSLKENMDTSNAGGKLIFHIFGALAEFEAELISQRTIAGQEAARKRGVKIGRPSVMTEKEIATASKLMEEKSVSIKEILNMYNVSRPTLYRLVGQYRSEIEC